MNGLRTADYIHPSPGPVELTVDAHSAEVRIVAARTPNAIVSLSTIAADPSVLDAFRRATADGSGHHLAITVPAPHATTGGSRPARSGEPATAHGALAKILSIHITVELPAGSSATVNLVSGNARCTAPLTVARVKCGQGEIRIDRADRAAVETVAGRITLGEALSADLHAGTGSIAVGTVTTLAASVATGEIAVECVRGHSDLRVGTGSIKAGFSGPPPQTRIETGPVHLRHTPPHARSESEPARA